MISLSHNYIVYVLAKQFAKSGIHGVCYPSLETFFKFIFEKIDSILMYYYILWLGEEIKLYTFIIEQCAYKNESRLQGMEE